MNLPGINTITISYNALGAMIEAELNKGRDGEPRVRVTDVNRPSSFKDELEFQITTDEPEPLPGPLPGTLPGTHKKPNFCALSRNERSRPCKA